MYKTSKPQMTSGVSAADKLPHVHWPPAQVGAIKTCTPSLKRASTGQDEVTMSLLMNPAFIPMNQSQWLFAL